MGDNYWEVTIEVLQGASPLVDKPKLSEKYLSKPPFRFLHDIITAVQSKTGFAAGLFEGDELDAKALQDKESKVTYLNKIINVVAIVLGEGTPAKPLKIVAGLEPENTNLFLQHLGRAALMGDGADAVRRVLGGEQARSTSEAGTAPPRAAKAAPPPPAAAPAAEEEEAPKPKSKPKKAAEPEPEPEPKKKSSSSRSKTSEDGEAPKKSSSSSSSSSRAKKEKEPEREEAPAPAAAEAAGARMGRPQSARKGPPKLASGPVPQAAGGGARPGTAQRSAPEAAAKPIALFEEGAEGGDDDDVEVVHERTPVAIGPRAVGDEQGVLVKDILEAEKNLKKTAEEGEEESGGSGIILKGRVGKGQGGTAIRANDHQGMREMVQKLTQCSNPLAKSMDYLQEDLENMSKEYRFWVTERRVFQEKLSFEQRMVGDQVAADARLADLDGQVRQVRDRIVGLKAGVLRNDELLNKLLGMAVSGGGR